MSKIDQRFFEDRALRDAARANFMADISHAKHVFSGKGLAGRVVDRVGEGAQDVFEVAKTQADDKRGIIAALVGAILLWLSREPVLELLGLTQSGSGADEEELQDEGEQPPTRDDPPLGEDPVQPEFEEASLPASEPGDQDD